MALSGTIIKNVGSYWRLRLYWTASQNIADNTSTITAKLYWEAVRSGVGYISSSATKSGSTTIEGSTDSFTNTAGLSAGQSRLIQTHTRTVSHNSDGRKSVTLSASFNIAVTLSGTYHSSVSLSDTVDLKDIPRASTLSSSPSWTVGSQKTVSVKRHSTSFRHTVKMYIKNRSGSWIHVNEVDLSTSQTSVSSGFSFGEQEYSFRQLDGRASADSRMVVHTYSGSKLIGTSTHDGTATAPQASFPDSPSAFDVGDSFRAEAKWYDFEFTHTIRLKNGSTVLKSYTGVTGNTSDRDAWVNFSTSSIANTIYGLMGNNTSINLTLEVITYYGSEQVRSPRSKTIKAEVPDDSAPSFSSSQISYDDINSTTVGITGNSQHIIQGKSTLRARIISAATPKNGASISHYVVSVNGISKTMSGVGYVTIGTINSSSSVTLSVKAVDNRGKSKTVSKTVTVIPYQTPNVNATARRAGGFGANTTLRVSGSISPLNSRNDLYSITYQYRKQNTGSYSSAAYPNFSESGYTFASQDVVLTLDEKSAWDMLVSVTDKLGTTQIRLVIPIGQPIWFIDSVKKAIGFNDFPKNPNEFRINGRLVFGANMWASTAQNGLHGAADFNNSDIIGLNGLYMSDVANNTGEGIMYLKSGATPGSTNVTDYNQHRIYNGVEFIDTTPVSWEGQGGLEILWEGVQYMNANQTAPASRNLLDCPNGWILVWSEYIDGAAFNGGWQFTHIPKRYSTLSAGGAWVTLTGSGGTEVRKYIYCTNTQVTGHSRNNSSNEATVVLRYIFAY